MREGYFKQLIVRVLVYTTLAFFIRLILRHFTH